MLKECCVADPPKSGMDECIFMCVDRQVGLRSSLVLGVLELNIMEKA